MRAGFPWVGGQNSKGHTIRGPGAQVRADLRGFRNTWRRQVPHEPRGPNKHPGAKPASPGSRRPDKVAPPSATCPSNTEIPQECLTRCGRTGEGHALPVNTTRPWSRIRKQAIPY